MRVREKEETTTLPSSKSLSPRQYFFDSASCLKKTEFHEGRAKPEDGGLGEIQRLGNLTERQFAPLRTEGVEDLQGPFQRSIVKGVLPQIVIKFHLMKYHE